MGVCELTIKIWWVTRTSITTCDDQLQSSNEKGINSKSEWKPEERGFQEIKLKRITISDLVLWCFISTRVLREYICIYEYICTYTYIHICMYICMFCFIMQLLYMLYLLVWDITKCNECPPWKLTVLVQFCLLGVLHYI